MGSRNFKYTTVINSAAAVSSAFSIAGLSDIGIFAPLVTSCQLYLQVAAGPTDPVSASFVRLLNLVNSVWVWPVGVGSQAAMADVGPFDFARLESNPVQTNQVTFTIVGSRK